MWNQTQILNLTLPQNIHNLKPHSFQQSKLPIPRNRLHSNSQCHPLKGSCQNRQHKVNRHRPQISRVNLVPTWKVDLKLKKKFFFDSFDTSWFQKKKIIETPTIPTELPVADKTGKAGTIFNATSSMEKLGKRRSERKTVESQKKILAR